ncbi:hypothetical protein Moror_9425 [Moniliophthora roreri MCA 2997]|uniref:Uncharacterized protein n=1 Tax=Moniliophthora roreri (strain MCA 2997) TaxID=1381753 RepID=V2Y2Z9_MONRO|nr:hypothetical protein Moror_9425 [Moniliophthora roreri MCA 2997]
MSSSLLPVPAAVLQLGFSILSCSAGNKEYMYVGPALNPGSSSHPPGQPSLFFRIQHLSSIANKSSRYHHVNQPSISISKSSPDVPTGTKQIGESSMFRQRFERPLGNLHNIHQPTPKLSSLYPIISSLKTVWLDPHSGGVNNVGQFVIQPQVLPLLLKSLSADAIFDYRDPEVVNKTTRQTGGQGKVAIPMTKILRKAVNLFFAVPSITSSFCIGTSRRGGDEYLNRVLFLVSWARWKVGWSD